MPTSHHFLGVGALSDGLASTAADPDRLMAEGRELVEASDLTVVDERAVRFDGGGLTAVWVLAESHLVLHLWPEEGSATIDLHVCDFRVSNEAAARGLVERLTGWAFVAGSERWREMGLPDVARPVAAAAGER